MKPLTIALAFVLTATPAFAQIGGLGKLVKKGRDAKEKVDQVRDIVITEADERKIGEKVSELVREEFGVYQDQDVTKYVTLVGTVLAQASSRPDLKWEFIVLDTDGVNAFASPGGLVHITKGALGLIKSEAELAGVLGHEIAHVTEKHTVNAIRKNKSVKFAADVAPGSNEYLEGIANAAYENIVEKGFDRGDEEGADEKGIRLANKVGYDPSGLATFLTMAYILPVNAGILSAVVGEEGEEGGKGADVAEDVFVGVYFDVAQAVEIEVSSAAAVAWLAVVRHRVMHVGVHAICGQVCTQCFTMVGLDDVQMGDVVIASDRR